MFAWGETRKDVSKFPSSAHPSAQFSDWRFAELITRQLRRFEIIPPSSITLLGSVFMCTFRADHGRWEKPSETTEASLWLGIRLQLRIAWGIEVRLLVNHFEGFFMHLLFGCFSRSSYLCVLPRKIHIVTAIWGYTFCGSHWYVGVTWTSAWVRVRLMDYMGEELSRWRIFPDAFCGKNHLKRKFSSYGFRWCKSSPPWDTIRAKVDAGWEKPGGMEEEAPAELHFCGACGAFYFWRCSLYLNEWCSKLLLFHTIQITDAAFPNELCDHHSL